MLLATSAQNPAPRRFGASEQDTEMAAIEDALVIALAQMTRTPALACDDGQGRLACRAWRRANRVTIAIDGAPLPRSPIRDGRFRRPDVAGPLRDARARVLIGQALCADRQVRAVLDRGCPVTLRRRIAWVPGVSASRLEIAFEAVAVDDECAAIALSEASATALACLLLRATDFGRARRHLDERSLTIEPIASERLRAARQRDNAKPSQGRWRAAAQAIAALVGLGLGDCAGRLAGEANAAV